MSTGTRVEVVEPKPLPAGVALGFDGVNKPLVTFAVHGVTR